MNKEQQEAKLFLQRRIQESSDLTHGLRYLPISLHDSIAIVMDEFSVHKSKNNIDLDAMFTAKDVIKIVANFAIRVDTGKMFDGSETLDYAMQEVQESINWDIVKQK